MARWRTRWLPCVAGSGKCVSCVVRDQRPHAARRVQLSDRCNGIPILPEVVQYLRPSVVEIELLRPRALSRVQCL